MADDKPTAPSEGGGVGQGDHVVQDGECIESIAFNHGHFWETLWNAPENEELRRVRGSPNVLLAGDRVHIPPLRRREEARPAEKKHRFRIKGVPSRLQVRVLEAGAPRANEPYELSIDGQVTTGQTDGDGWIRVSLPPDAREGVLVVGSDPMRQRRHALQFGGIDPVTELKGVQQRLANLGYPCDVNGNLDETTQGAVSAFQKDNEMEPTGAVDDRLREKLLEVHGS